MARLSKDEWAELRAEWEASPRRGLTWLLASAGGRWQITEEAVRRKRLAEVWQKPTDLAATARRARSQADTLSAARIAARGMGEQPPDPDVGEPPESGGDPQKGGARQTLAEVGEDAALDMRTRLIERHRAEWNAARKLVYEAMKLGEAALGFEKAKFAKIATEALRNIQEGERRAWSLDADLLDFDAMTDAQLQAVASGRLPR